MDLLVYLARNAGRTVPHGELLANIWPNQPFIAGSVLPRCVAELRQTLGDHAADSVVIQTIPKRGYRLIAEVKPATNGAAVADATVRRPLSHLSLASVAGSPVEPVPLPMPHDAGVAAWLLAGAANGGAPVAFLPVSGQIGDGPGCFSCGTGRARESRPPRGGMRDIHADEACYGRLTARTSLRAWRSARQAVAVS